MEVSGLDNASTAPTKSSANAANDSGGSKGKQAAEAKSSVSNEPRTSPPPGSASESGNESAAIPTAEGNTGGQVNVTV